LLDTPVAHPTDRFDMHIVRRFASFTLAAIVSALPATAPAAADAPLTLLPDRSGARAAYTFRFEGHFGVGRQDKLDDVISIGQKSAGVVVLDAKKCKPFELSTSVDESGLLKQADPPSALGDIIIDYNSIVKLAQHARREAGAAWNAQIPVRLSPDTWQDLPVAAKVTSATNGGLAIEGNGHQETMLYFSGFTFPVDVSVHMAESFRPDGHLADADLSVSEVTAGGSGPPISYAWQMRAQ